MWNESDGDKNYCWGTHYCHQKFDTGTGGLGNQRTSGDHLCYSISKICQNTEKCHGDLRLLGVSQTPVKTHQLTPGKKLTKEKWIIILIIFFAYRYAVSSIPIKEDELRILSAEKLIWCFHMRCWWSNHCHIHGRNMGTIRETMLENKPNMITFHENMLVSPRIFLAILVILIFLKQLYDLKVRFLRLMAYQPFSFI